MKNLTMRELKLICAMATVENIDDDCEVFFNFESVELYVNEKDFDVAVPVDDLDENSDRLVKTIKHTAFLSGFDKFEKESEDSIILKFKGITV